VQIVLKSGSLNLLESLGPVQACNGIALLLPLPLILSPQTTTKRQEFGQLFSGIFLRKNMVLDTVIKQNSIAGYGKGRQTDHTPVNVFGP
jgi:hypothetical protein